MKTILVLFLAASMAIAAPVPKDVHKAPEVQQGVFTLMWGNSNYTATFNGNGEFSEFIDANGVQWTGTWTWNSEYRILAVNETSDGGYFWMRWVVCLDSKMRGTTDGGTKVELKPFRVPQKMQEK